MKWVVLSTTVFILGFFNFFAPVRGGIQYVFNPIQFGIQNGAIFINDWFEFYANLKKIRAENLKLLDQNEVLREQLVRLNELIKENKLLKEQLNIKVKIASKEEMVLAEAVGNLEDRAGVSITLNKGRKSGIAKDDVVIKGGYLLGVVKDVSNFRSEVELITSPNMLLNVYDMQTGTFGVSKGQYGTSLKVSRILPEEEVNVGDIFVSSGKEGVVSPGLIVGEVTEVSKQSARTLREVSLNVLVDLDHLGKVFVLSKKDAR